MTYAEALKNGYGNADTRYQVGYVSRKIDVDMQEVLTAGGKRKGDLYVLLPCWHTTRFCFRQYLKEA